MTRRLVLLLTAALVAAALAAPQRDARAQAGATQPLPSISGDDLMLRAAEAFRQKDRALLFTLRQVAAAQDHPLASWIEYWELLNRLPDAQHGDFEAFAERWRGTYVEDRMRNDWLLELGRRRDWANLRAEYPRFRMNDDREVTCYALLAQYLDGGQDVRAAARRAWLAQRDSDDGCHLLGATLVERRVFGAEEVWQALRVATEHHRVRLARERAALLDAGLAAQVEAVFKDPARWLRERRAGAGVHAHRLAGMALWRMAASDPDQAAQWLEQHEAARLPPEELARAWSGIARQASFRQQAKAAEYARRSLAVWDKVGSRGRPTISTTPTTTAPATMLRPAGTTAAADAQGPGSAPHAQAPAAVSSTSPAVALPGAPGASAAPGTAAETVLHPGAAAPAPATATLPATAPATEPAAPAPAGAAAVTPAHAAAESPFSDETLAWMARAALRQPASDKARWALVLRTIEEMSAVEQRDPAWVYWRARAVRAGAPSGPEGDGARALARHALESIAGPLGFYQQLAQEDLGRRVQLPAAPVPLVESEREPIRQHPGLRRALRLMSLGLRGEGVREWNYTLRGMNDRELLAAATLACEREFWDRCINTSERTRDVADIGQRYPLPFRDAVLSRAGESGVDAAYVYGLIRQESRFILDARSSVGASGLMQLMPGTARWTARRAGLADWRPELVTERDTNLLLGTTYLKLVLDEFGGAQAMGAAAYNAGPSRPRRWREGAVVEPAAWIEGIPFNETRDYVKKVLSNAVVYSLRLQQQHGGAAASAPFGAASLKARLGGPIGPRDPAAPAENRELP